LEADFAAIMAGAVAVTGVSARFSSCSKSSTKCTAFRKGRGSVNPWRSKALPSSDRPASGAIRTLGPPLEEGDLTPPSSSYTRKATF
jgi:hypothetical protein